MTEIRPLTPAYPALARSYDAEFRVDPAYKDSLPDLQNGPASLIVGARTAIQHVGISNFRLPIRYLVRDGGEITLETSVTGTVSLEADRKGINMSRIMRSFYGHADHAFSLSVLEAALCCGLRGVEAGARPSLPVQRCWPSPKASRSIMIVLALSNSTSLATPPKYSNASVMPVSQSSWRSCSEKHTKVARL